MTHPVIFSEAIAEEQRLKAKGDNVVDDFVRRYCYQRKFELGSDEFQNTIKYRIRELS